LSTQRLNPPRPAIPSSRKVFGRQIKIDNADRNALAGKRKSFLATRALSFHSHEIDDRREVSQITKSTENCGFWA
jgi:hypothetical protein